MVATGVLLFLRLYLSLLADKCLDGVVLLDDAGVIFHGVVVFVVVVLLLLLFQPRNNLHVLMLLLQLPTIDLIVVTGNCYRQRQYN